MNRLKIDSNGINLEKEDGNLSLKVNKTNKFLSVRVIKIKVMADTDLIIESDVCDIKYDLSINVLKDVHVNLYELKKGDNNKIHYNYYLDKNSYLNVEKINDVNNVLEMSVFNLNGEGARAYYNLKTISKTKENYNFLVYHNAKKTVSYINNNGVNILDGELLFNVSSFVPNDILKCDVNQSGRIINMTENECTIKPNLFIDEEDVVANHSALIGTFTFDEIFYLESRGISKVDAEKLLTKGFLMKGITYHKEKLEDIINKYWR